jgi:hypothetical protein
LLQAPPKPLKIDFAQFFAHIPQPYQNRIDAGLSFAGA